MKTLRAALTRGVLAWGLVLQGCEGDPGPPEARLVAPSSQEEDGVLHLLGTGAMMPLARNLGSSWGKTPEGAKWRVVVEPSVGSGGGVRAVRDGIIDLGMISRPLKEQEKALGLIVVPVALSGVVLATNQNSPRSEMSSAEVRKLYAGESLGAKEGFLLLRDREESANVALERWFPELKALREQAYLQHRARVLFHDEAMREALASTPGGIGVVDLGAVLGEQGLLKGLTIDSITPTLETLRDGRWKASRELAFVYRPERAQRVEAFLNYTRSEGARRVIEMSGCVATSGAP